ncbi:NADPH-dependent FMN reductase [Thermomonospora amylolytica]|uniref:NADPH-dependent FMN reductase n=1 Tax=Thermomonospora amylolytica TaxID=1411117 RepID=UPI000E6C5847|nr:NAD(P)H-dependent oxidoreductase [Thermomonospora amylolytica]
MIRVGVILGSTRPNRRGEQVLRWVTEVAARHPAVAEGEVAIEPVDLADQGLPLLDEPAPPMAGGYRRPHTLRWAETIDALDGFVFVTPEYNHSIPGALKNAVDFLYAEWNHKAAGFVGYGPTGAIRAVEHLRLILAEVKVAGVRDQVALSMFNEWEWTDPADPAHPGRIAPGEHQEPTLMQMLDDVIAWSRALRPLRQAPVSA